ncbi:dTDP-4-dehydrorhamnose 3,5-epimerase [Prochlorococcus sp. AH-716-E13]|nr:dTDP-4-dehydrorhamnose 3,5-epimerase [Prochlorococcus sp. AH-716-E13]
MLNNKITLTPIEKIKVEGGDLIKNIKVGDNGYKNFQETYYSFINLGKKKGWKKHLKMTLNLTCPMGEVNFVFSEDLKYFEKIILSKDNLFRITVSPGIWFAFEGLYRPYSIINNVADMIHDPKEIERKNLSEVHYKW